MLSTLLSAMHRMGARRLRGTIDPQTGRFDIEMEAAGPAKLGYNANELADLLGVSPFLVNDWGKRGILSSFKEGKTRFFLLPTVAHDIAMQVDLAAVSDGRPETERRMIDWVLGRAPIPPHWEAA